MTLSQIAAEARQLMNDHGLQSWSLGWDRSVHRMGYCDYRRRLISLSRLLVVRAPIEMVRNTILHEIAHAKVGPGHGHNRVWKSAARAIGCTGDRCFDGTKVETVPGKWQAVCPSCGDTKHKHRAPRPGYRYGCGRCGFSKGLLTYTMVSR